MSVASCFQLANKITVDPIGVPYIYPLGVSNLSRSNCCQELKSFLVDVQTMMRQRCNDKLVVMSPQVLIQSAKGLIRSGSGVDPVG
jgi:hypothetical protein